MSGEGTDSSDTTMAGAAKTADSQARQRSTIDFPYLSLEAAEEVAAAIYKRCGHGACETDELAAEMRQSISGAFRQKTSAARTFDLVTKDGRSAFILTDTGRKIVVENSATEGRVEAFLSVPLYAAIFEGYRGHRLPPSKALEREMESLGVAHKQTDKARQAFERSAQYAGFFEAGRDRLVRPRIGMSELPPSRNEDEDNGDGADDANVGDKSPPVDPIIQGLLARLPATGSGWPESERKLWINLLEGSFKLIYKDQSSGGEETDDISC